jgi:hypothetical protein
MKKLATIIGLAVVALAGPLAQGAGAMPADVTPLTTASRPLPAVALQLGSGHRLAVQGVTPAEYRAVVIRSEALNQKYGLGGIGSVTLERGATQRFASNNPTKDDLVASTPPETSTGFAWGDAGVAASVLLAAMGIATVGVASFRHHRRPLGTA